MAIAVLDWKFAASGVSNADGSQSAFMPTRTEVPGPGNTVFGVLLTALQFGPGIQCKTQLSPSLQSSTRFAVRIAFRVTAAVSGRMNLIESTGVPFALYLDRGVDINTYNVFASVSNGNVGWTGPNTANRRRLELNQWTTASLVFDLDTVALLINDEVVGITAFPLGGLTAPLRDQLFVGTWVNGQRWPLQGEVAGVQVWQDIPEQLETLLDTQRNSPEWHLSRKENALRPTMNLGPKTADFYYDPATGSFVQPFALASLSYTESYGVAFELHGAILQKWRSDENLRRALGPVASDEINGRRAGSKKNSFKNGAIYWSAQTGAVACVDRIYLDFEQINEGASAIGLPTAAQEAIAGGFRQVFQFGHMYYRSGASNAFEVHGAILQKYLALGGPARFGFPVTHEKDILRNGASVGKVSEFESASIYWSPQTGACAVYGDIRARFLGEINLPGEGGPLGHLGFPTSDEGEVPGAAGARYNTFQNGSIVWFGNRASTFVCTPFTVFFGKLDTKEEDRDFLDVDGQNDLYVRACIDVNGGRVFDKKYPENTTHYSSANVKDLNLNVPHTLLPNNANLNVRVRLEVWESDDGNLFGGGDDALGTMTRDLNMANAWGLRDNAAGLFRASNFGPWVNSLDWSVKPVINPQTPVDFWAVTNRSTDDLTYREYAAAFSDVDPDFEVGLDIIDDGLKALFYEAVVKDLAEGGNCFGMATEAIYAYKGMSRLGRPLARFNNWADVEDDFNVKHAYQVGADAIWWFVGQFLSGNTHNPVDVFQETWDAHNRGLDPVLCIAQNYDFSGAPHCVLPVSWNRNVTPWQIEIFDPNFMNSKQILFVDPNTNTFRYDPGTPGGTVYAGSQWSGGRMHYMPWSAINHQSRTPVWDAILLLLSGVVVVFADGVEVDAVRDENARDITAAGVRSANDLRGKLVPVHGLFGGNSFKGRMYAGRVPARRFTLDPAMVARVNSAVSLLSATTLRAEATVAGGTAIASTASIASSSLRAAMLNPPSARPPVASDAPANALLGSALVAQLQSQGLRSVFPKAGPTDLDAMHFALQGKGGGTLNGYIKTGMQGVQVQGAMAAAERLSFGLMRLGRADNEIAISPDRSRTVDVRVYNQLGAGKDHLRVSVGNLGVSKAAPLRINAQPGLGTLDILSESNGTVQLALEGRINGKPIEAKFAVDLKAGGQRLVLNDVFAPSVLKVGSIDTLMGAARNFKLVNKT